MNTLIYRPNGRSLMWAAFGCATAIHLAAIALAETKSQLQLVTLIDGRTDIVGVDLAPASPAIEPEQFSPADPPPPVRDDYFPEDISTPPTTYKKKPLTAQPIVRSIGKTSPAYSGPIRAAVLYGPRPPYPYEARRDHVTGSGIALLTIDPSTGRVIDARMRQSTGSAVLDNVTVDTLRGWRFKPIGMRTVNVPITYTLAGGSY